MNTFNTSGVSRENYELGQRLRVIRERSGISQRALAKKVGIPNSTISLIESGKTNPSVGSLRKILDGIPVSLSEFFAFEPEPERQIFYASEELVEIGKGKVSLKQVGATLFGRAMMLLKETYEPGADTGRVMYGHEGEEGGIVVSGRIEITVGEERKILGPGDAYYFDSRLPHRFRQVGPEPCHLFSACTPPTF
ncbi:cupin domain-containing protein [Celeribacter halophilus]|jgi:transcriptional regulator with XRE-family HTH domain|uniref:cupin domain-containing protein n=1 Tax=Celeribacter halophilus TaxID=576117 RepID=UPI001C09676D|nr:cupin domain-containing protein [Celeribacter halophilus]MBU2888404.1 cupin domain-containing protein [Celeribacter halophilus]MDO6509242.1 cupin domain-containing protein [Celeribacter halophilus]